MQVGERAHLERIARELGIRYEPIADYGVVTTVEGIHSLLRMEDDTLRLRPERVGVVFRVARDGKGLAGVYIIACGGTAQCFA